MIEEQPSISQKNLNRLNVTALVRRYNRMIQWHLKRLYGKFEVKLFMNVSTILFPYKNTTFLASWRTICKQSSRVEIFVSYSPTREKEFITNGRASKWIANWFPFWFSMFEIQFLRRVSWLWKSLKMMRWPLAMINNDAVDLQLPRSQTECLIIFNVKANFFFVFYLTFKSLLAKFNSFCSVSVCDCLLDDCSHFHDCNCLLSK